MVTIIEADARYTHVIFSRNIRRSTNPEAKPIPKPGDPSRQVITCENNVPTVPYLFIMCGGTWEMLADEIVYPCPTTVRLEYLVPSGRKDSVRVPMKILKESILWQGASEEYECQRDVCRIISMERSNFGGMRNVGNTAIVAEDPLDRRIHQRRSSGIRSAGHRARIRSQPVRQRHHHGNSFQYLAE